MSDYLKIMVEKFNAEYEEAHTVERIKTGMTLEEAKKIVRVVINICQKMRSNVLETMSGGREEPDEIDQYILGDLTPGLFSEYSGKLGVLETAIRMYEKDVIEPMSLYNLLYMFHADPVLHMCSEINYWDQKIPEVSPIPKWIAGFDDA